MSVRAYRVIEMNLADASFNVYRDQELMDFLLSEGELLDGLPGCAGLADVSVAVLQRAVRRSARLNLDEDTVARLKEDIAFAKSRKDETVTYYCF